MPTMSYTIAEQHLDAVAETINMHIKRMRAGKAGIDSASSALAQIPSEYADLITYINAQATANPDDPAWQAIKGRLDALADDFNLRATTATNMSNALAPFDP